MGLYLPGATLIWCTGYHLRTICTNDECPQIWRNLWTSGTTPMGWRLAGCFNLVVSFIQGCMIEEAFRTQTNRDGHEEATIFKLGRRFGIMRLMTLTNFSLINYAVWIYLIALARTARVLHLQLRPLENCLVEGLETMNDVELCAALDAELERLRGPTSTYVRLVSPFVKFYLYSGVVWLFVAASVMLAEADQRSVGTFGFTLNMILYFITMGGVGIGLCLHANRPFDRFMSHLASAASRRRSRDLATAHGCFAIVGDDPDEPILLSLFGSPVTLYTLKAYVVSAAASLFATYFVPITKSGFL